MAKVVTIEEYIYAGGLKKILNFKSRQELVELFPPSWIDNLKKGKSRVNYQGNEGRLEIVFQNDEIITEHFDPEKNDINGTVSLIFKSSNIYFGIAKERLVSILAEQGLEKMESSYFDNYESIKLSNGVILGLLDNKFFNIDIDYGMISP